MRARSGDSIHGPWSGSRPHLPGKAPELCAVERLTDITHRGPVPADAGSEAVAAGHLLSRAGPAARDDPSLLSSWPNGRFGVMLDGIPAAADRGTEPDAEERHPSAAGVPWDFSGTSGPIKRHERETAERPFAQVSDHQPFIGQVTAFPGP